MLRTTATIVSSRQKNRPFELLEDIAKYLRNYMSEFRNPSFYAYQLDGTGQYINDGGGDMYDQGNFTTPWLLAGTTYTSSGGIGSFPLAINYTNNTTTIVDTDFNYISLGYQQFSGVQSLTFLPLTVIGTRRNNGKVGWQVGGNSGADGGGTLASGTIYSGSTVNGFTTYAFYRETYNAGDPSHCNLFILLGHPRWDSNFGAGVSSFADPVANGGNGAYYYVNDDNARNILAIHTLLSKSSGQLVTAAECQTVVDNFTLRIKQSIGY